MIRLDVLAEARLQAELQRAEHTSHDLDANLNAAVGLRFVGRRALCLHVIHGLPFLQVLGHAILQCNNSLLIISLDNDLGVAEPLNISHGELGAVVVLVIAFLRHHMREQVLAAETTH